MLDCPHLSAVDLSAAGRALQTLDLTANGLRTLDVVAVAEGNATDAPPPFGELVALRLGGNAWHCDCALRGSLRTLVANASAAMRLLGGGTDVDGGGGVARCASPHAVSTRALDEVLLTVSAGDRFGICGGGSGGGGHGGGGGGGDDRPRWSPLDGGAYVRPRQIVVTVASVCAVVALGLAIGAAIVCVKRRLRAGVVELRGAEGGAAAAAAAAGVRYTTVRNSSSVPVARQESTRRDCGALVAMRPLRAAAAAAEPRAEQMR